MKLRIKGNSLRLRIAPSELERLRRGGRLEDTIRFGAGPDACLTYSLEGAPGSAPLAVRYVPSRVTVSIGEADLRRWAATEEVGIYGSVPVGEERLDISVEKDFACIDKEDADNADTFPNPHEGAVC